MPDSHVCIGAAGIAQSGSEMESRVRCHASPIQVICTIPIELMQERIAALHIQCPHATEVRSEMPFADEFGQGNLQWCRGLSIAKGSRSRKGFGKTWRRDKKPHAETRSQNFGESPDIDYPIHCGLSSQRTQRMKRAAGITIVPVSIILDDPRMGLLRPGK